MHKNVTVKKKGRSTPETQIFQPGIIARNIFAALIVCGTNGKVGFAVAR